MDKGTKRPVRAARRMALVLALAAFGAIAAAIGTASAAPPATTPARTGPPGSVAVLGDSMSAGTGTAGVPGTEQPANSWATGTNASVESYYQRLLAINPSASGKNYQMAANGKKMTDMAGQAATMPDTTQLVLVQMGGNDLCKDTVADMTPLATYRAQFVAGLDAIEARNPAALIQVDSIPDIFNLWYLRGAPNPPNDQPSSRASTARFFWDTLAVIPCKSLVDNPTDMSVAAQERREAVRTRDIAFNQILAEECALRIRCRFDNNATFNFSSNRADPPYGAYLPRAQWQFVDDDISTIDHFHPGLSGQKKMSQAAWEAGYQYSDSTAPAVSTSAVVPRLTNGASLTAPTVTIGYSDAAGIKGIEYRLRTGAAAGSWQTSLTSSVAVPVNTLGVSWVETRAQDTNGNLSASSMTEVNFDPNAPIPAPQITSAPSGLKNVTTASIAVTGETGLTLECKLDSGTYSPCTSPVSLTDLGQGDHTWSVRLTDGSNHGSTATATWSVDSLVPEAPAIPAPPATWINSKSTSIAFTGENAATFECSVDGAAFSSCNSPRSITVVGEGAHSFAVKQTDAAANVSPVRTVSWNVDTVAPAAPGLTGTPPSRTKSTAATFVLTPEDAFAQLQCSFDDAAYENCMSPYGRTGLSEGSHYLKVRQVDRAGNVSATSSSSSWTVDTTAPAAPQITGTPLATWLNSKTTSIAFTGENAATFECSVDGAAFSSCTSPRSITVVGEGAHSFAVKQTDAAANVSPVQLVSWNVDTIAPVTPGLTGTPLSPTKSTEATFVLTPENAFAQLQCSFDSAAYDACTSPYSRTGLSEGSHNLRVRQVDRAGNVSPVRSSSAWTVDTTAPAAPQISGAPSGLTSSTAESIAFTGEPGGSFECKLDTGAFEDCTTPKSFDALGNGPHTFLVRQRDQANNTGPVSSATWEVDSEAAAPTVTSVPPALTKSGSASISFTGKPGATFGCSLDDGAFAACTSPHELSGLGDGQHTLKIRQTDPANNTSLPATVTWTRDSTAPAPVVITPPKNIVHPVRNHSLAFTGEPGGSFECRTDGEAWSACTSPAAADFPSDGTHTLDVRQTDAAGNTGPPRTATWRIDTVAPAAPGLSGAPSGTVRSTTATLNISPEPGARFECALNGAGWSSCPSPWTLTGLAQGAQKAEVRQIDEAGNTSPVASAVWTVDTVAPALTRVTAKVKGKRKKRKTTISTTLDSSKGTPKAIEWSTASGKPSALAQPVKVTVRGWNPKLVIKGPKKIRWVRVSDELGNQSPWYPVR